MTFKHMKFEDSPTMRALEKVAKEKGLVKPETLEKKASVTKKADYSPTHDLMENILKLCAGLRTQGLAKEASEIETNFLNYKQAQTLYETSKEKGEDLVDSAHPKGSHKLEGVEGDEATFETIVDQHLKNLEMISKKPTGKLSNASILSSVKKALGQVTAPQESESDLYNTMNQRLNKLLADLGAVISVLKLDGGPDYDTEGADAGADALRAAVAARPFTRDKYRAAMAALNQIQNTSKSGAYKTSEWFGSPDANDPGLAAWNKRAGGMMGKLVNNLRSIEPLISKIENIRVLKEQGTYQSPEDAAKKNTITLPEQTLVSDPLVVKLQNLVNQLKAYMGVLSIARDPQAKQWIADEIKEISDTQDRIDDMSENTPAQRKQLDARLQQDVSTFEQEVSQFERDWVNAAKK